MSPSRALSLILAVALPWLAPVEAKAQLSGAVGLTSDYRLRGFSLTDGRGVAIVSANYDHAGGAYAGGALIGHDPPGRAPRLLGYQAYAGIAGRFAGGPRRLADHDYEYPVASGAAADAALPDISTLRAPDVDLSDLGDLRGSLEMMREAGIVP